MYERLLSGGKITLFSPHDVPGLYEAYFGDADKFQELYESYERKTSIKKKSIDAMELFSALIKERAETGRIYIMNVDHCNSHSSFKDTVYMSNLCQEITLPTKPLQHIDDDQGEIALCILSAINVGVIKSLDDLEDLCDLAVRALEEIIDYQKYPIVAAEKSTKARRSLGIGYIGLAHYLAKQGVSYDSKRAWKYVHDLSEAFQYYLLKASNTLAEERGACEYFNRTKYSEGILPIDTYKKDIAICSFYDFSFLYLDFILLPRCIVCYHMNSFRNRIFVKLSKTTRIGSYSKLTSQFPYPFITHAFWTHNHYTRFWPF